MPFQRSWKLAVPMPMDKAKTIGAFKAIRFRSKLLRLEADGARDARRHESAPPGLPGPFKASGLDSSINANGFTWKLTVPVTHADTRVRRWGF